MDEKIKMMMPPKSGDSQCEDLGSAVRCNQAEACSAGCCHHQGWHHPFENCEEPNNCIHDQGLPCDPGNDPVTCIKA